MQTWRAVYACLPRPPTAQASINAAAVPRVATASGDRALEKSYKPKKLLSLQRWCLIVILTLFGQWVCAAASSYACIIFVMVLCKAGEARGRVGGHGR